MNKQSPASQQTIAWRTKQEIKELKPTPGQCPR
uniref:Uncharacterized protein n=1 Tax=Arundo donax TaxID=35708 RepID=A0A0A9E9G3_ARUDO